MTYPVLAFDNRTGPARVRRDATNVWRFLGLLWIVCFVSGCKSHKVPPSGIDEASLRGRTVTVESTDGPVMRGTVTWVTQDSIAVLEPALAPAPSMTRVIARSEVASVTVVEGHQIPGAIFGFVLATIVILGTILALTLEDPGLR